LDAPGTLSSAGRVKLERLLIEHDRATGEQIFIAILPPRTGEDPGAVTNQLFYGWKVGQRGKDTGVLLALFPQGSSAHIAVGTGLESVLTEPLAQRLIRDKLLPGLRKSGWPKTPNAGDTPVLATTVELFKLLDSPLLKTDRAEQILGPRLFKQVLVESSVTLPPWLLTAVLLGGAVVLLVLVLLFSDRPVIATSRGWRRAGLGETTRMLLKAPPKTAGGIHGRW